MTDIQANTLTLNGVEYIRKDSTTQNIQIGEKRIIVGDRGWVFVGNCIDNSDGSVTITNTLNIRCWGTTTGLGELRNGPTTKTVTDVAGTVRLTPIVTYAVVSGW